MLKHIGIQRLFMALFITWFVCTIVLSSGASIIIADESSFRTIVLAYIFTFLLANIPFSAWILHWFKNKIHEDIRKTIRFDAILVLIVYLAYSFFSRNWNVFIALACGIVLAVPGLLIWLLYWIANGFILSAKKNK